VDRVRILIEELSSYFVPDSLIVDHLKLQTEVECCGFEDCGKAVGMLE
jgi:hypothetical protein